MDAGERPPQGVLPVTTIEDLSRADLGATHVVQMVVHEEFAGRAAEMQAALEERLASERAAAGAHGEAGSPFHGEGWQEARHNEAGGGPGAAEE